MVKDWIQSAYNLLPFKCIPYLILVHLVANTVFWLNAFLPANGTSSDSLSLHYLLTGKHLDYQKHIHMEFGAYVQIHEEHTNDMMPHMIGAICLGLSSNKKGRHYFMPLMTSYHLLWDRWMELPMPHDAIAHVSHMGWQQGMPKSLTFVDCYGFEILDAATGIDDDHDSDYYPADDMASSSSDSDSSTDDDDSDQGDNFTQPLLGLTARVEGNHDHNDEDDNDDGNHSDDDHSDDGHSEHGNDNDSDGSDDDEDHDYEDDNSGNDANDADDDNHNDDVQHTDDSAMNNNQILKSTSQTL